MSQPPKPPLQKARGLGRGLSALLGDEDVAVAVAAPTEEPKQELSRPGSRAPLTLPIAQLRPGRMQPRTAFEGLEALVESIREHGLLQPILVRRIPSVDEAYEIVAGERRWRAAQQAQLHEVPVVLRDLDDRESLQLGLVENLQRTDLSPMDEARGYRRLIDQFDQTQEGVAQTIGKSRPHVANTLRLLDLPDAVQVQVHLGSLSAGHARALVGMPEVDAVALAKRAVDEKLSVRQLEHIVQKAKAPAGAARARASAALGADDGKGKTADTKALEKRIEEALGLKADLKLRGLGEQCLLTLQIRDFDQLDSVVERLTRR